MAVFEYIHPGDIDGEPREVRDETLALLARLAALVATLTEDARKQLINAGLSEAIEFGALNPAEGYGVRRPKEARLVEQLDNRGEQFERFVRVLAKATDDYDQDPDAALGLND